MYQDIAPKTYHCEYGRYEAGEADYAMLFQQEAILLCDDQSGFKTFKELGIGTVASQYLFSIDDHRFFLVSREISDPFRCDGCSFFAVNGLLSSAPEWVSFSAFIGLQLMRWYTNNTFCGRCGQPFVHSETERALCCADCNNTVYPTISPVVIVGVTCNDRLLVTRYANRNQKFESLVAGFCETGETLEDSCRREVFEEASVHIKNMRYFKSQPWGLSSSLLIGIYAELDGELSEAHADGVELESVRWVNREDIQPRERSSLTADMIQSFREKADAFSLG